MQKQRYNAFNLSHLVPTRERDFEIKKTPLSANEPNQKKVEYLVDKNSQLRLTKNANLREKVGNFLLCAAQPTDDAALSIDVRGRAVPIATEKIDRTPREDVHTDAEPGFLPGALPSLQAENRSYTLEDSASNKNVYESVTVEPTISPRSATASAQREATTSPSKLSASVSEEKLEEIEKFKSNRYYSTETNRQKCFYCRKIGHIKADCPQNKALCHYCLAGHLRNDCPSAVTCMNCGSHAHIRTMCPNNNKKACYRCNRVHKSRICPFVTMNPKAIEEDAKSGLRGLKCFSCFKLGHVNCSLSLDPASFHAHGDRLFDAQFRTQLKTDSRNRQALDSFLRVINSRGSGSAEKLRNDEMIRKRSRPVPETLDQFSQRSPRQRPQDNFHRNNREFDGEERQQSGRNNRRHFPPPRRNNSRPNHHNGARRNNFN